MENAGLRNAGMAYVSAARHTEITGQLSCPFTPGESNCPLQTLNSITPCFIEIWGPSALA